MKRVHTPQRLRRTLGNDRGDVLAGIGTDMGQMRDSRLAELIEERVQGLLVARLTDVDLLDLTLIAGAFGYPTTIEAQDTAMSPRGYRLLARISRLQFAHIDRLVRSFGTLQALLATSAADLQAVEGISSIWARHIRDGLSRLAESSIERYE